MYLVGMSARSPEPQSVDPHPGVLVPPGQATLPLKNTVCQGPQGWGETRTMSPPKKRVPSLGVAGVGSYTSDSMNRPRPGFQLMPARGVNFRSDSKTIGVASTADEHHAGLVSLPQKYCQLAWTVRSVRDPRIRVNPGTRS